MMISPEHVRATLDRLAIHRGESLASLSRLIGRNEAYLQQFVRRGTPLRLPEDARLILAQYFDIDERLLGARDPWVPLAPSPPTAHSPPMENPASLTDADLLAAYHQTTGEPHDPIADALCKEIERRGLDL